MLKAYKLKGCLIITNILNCHVCISLRHFRLMSFVCKDGNFIHIKLFKLDIKR